MEDPIKEQSTADILSTDVQYSKTVVPFHIHNGIDSPHIPMTAGTGISFSPSAGEIGAGTIIRNTGVTSLTAGTNITVSGTTGAITVSSSVSQTGYVGGTSVTMAASKSGNTSSGTYAKVAEFTLNSGFPVTFLTVGSVLSATRTPPGAYTIWSTVYKNGVAFGAEQTSAGSDPPTVSQTEYLRYSGGDLVQLYVKTNDPTSVATGSLTIFGTVITTVFTVS